MYPLMTLEFAARDIYGMDVPDLKVKVEVLQDVTASDYTLPDVYTEADRINYHSGMWQIVSVRVSLYNRDDVLVARHQTDGNEFGQMGERYVNPIGNPDDFPLSNSFWYAMDDYRERNGMPL